jgi:TniQ
MSIRPLPRSLDPLPGESLNGYLLRLYRRLRVSPLHLARITGCTGGRQSFIGRRPLFDLDVARFARAARLTGGEAAALTAASWTGRYPLSGGP